MASKAKLGKTDAPILSRAEVARILNVTSLTISNREKRKQYPLPKRDLNGYRIYSVKDVFELQLITYSHIDPKPIMAVLHDKGYTEPKVTAQIIDDAKAEF